MLHIHYKSKRRSEFESQLRSDFGDRIRYEEPLSKHSSLRIGGPALVWVEPQDVAELMDVVAAATASGLSVYPTGLGSNSLFPDAGIDGVMIRLSGALAGWTVNDGIAELGGGAVNAHLVRGLLKLGWVGMEFLALIPGTLGGAVAMNAGTKERELSDMLIDAQIIDPLQPRMVKTMSCEELNLRYRHADLPDNAIVVGARVRVQTGDVDAAKANVDADKARRNLTQPYRLASVGSTFANPEGDYAGRLIEAVGLKGHRIGGACVSELHANFFINQENASAKDFITLMATARRRVRDQFGVDLRPEVCFVGFDGWSEMKEIEASL